MPNLRTLAHDVLADIRNLDRAAQDDSNDAEIAAGHAVATDATALAEAVLAEVDHDDTVVLTREEFRALRNAIGYLPYTGGLERRITDAETVPELMTGLANFAQVLIAHAAQDNRDRDARLELEAQRRHVRAFLGLPTDPS